MRVMRGWEGRVVWLYGSEGLHGMRVIGEGGEDYMR